MCDKFCKLSIVWIPVAIRYMEKKKQLHAQSYVTEWLKENWKQKLYSSFNTFITNCSFV